MKNYFIGLLMQFLMICVKYISIMLAIALDAIVFAYPVMLINNNILNKLYTVPFMGYYDGVGIILILKIVFILFNIPNYNQEIIENIKED